MPVSHLKLCRYLFCFASICYIFHPQLQFCTVLPILLTLRVSVKHSTLMFARCSLIYPHLKHSSREKVIFQRLSVCLIWRIALVSHSSFRKRTILLIVSNSSLQKRPILVLTHSELQKNTRAVRQLPTALVQLSLGAGAGNDTRVSVL